MSIINLASKHTKKTAIFLSILILFAVLVPTITINVSAVGVANSVEEIKDKISKGEKQITISSALAVYSSMEIPSGVTVTITSTGHITSAGDFTINGLLQNKGRLTIAGGNFKNNNEIVNDSVLTISGGSFINDGVINNNSSNGMFVYSDLTSSINGVIKVNNGGLIYYVKNFYDANGNQISDRVTDGVYKWNSSVRGFKETNETSTTDTVNNNVEKISKNTDTVLVNSNPTKPIKTLSAYGNKTVYTAEITGAVGIILPKINNLTTQYADISKFDFDMSTDGGKTFKKITNQNGYWSNRSQKGEIVIGAWLTGVKKDIKVRIFLKGNTKDSVIYDVKAFNSSVAPTKPTNPVTTKKPEQTSPNKPEQTSPNKPEQTNPSKPEQTSPNKPEQTSPNKPEQTSPNKPEQTKPQISNFTPNILGDVGRQSVPITMTKSVLFMPSYKGKPILLADLKDYRIDLSFDNGKTYVAMTDYYSYGYTSPTKGMYGFWDQPLGNGQRYMGMWIKPVNKSAKLRVARKDNVNDCIVYSLYDGKKPAETTPVTTKKPVQTNPVTTETTSQIVTPTNPIPTQDVTIEPFNRDGVLKNIEVESNGNSGIGIS